MAFIRLNLSLRLLIINTHKKTMNCLFIFNNLLIKLIKCHYLSTTYFNLCLLNKHHWHQSNSLVLKLKSYLIYFSFPLKQTISTPC